MYNYHTPVLVDEVLSFLITNTSGVYVDGTLGGGGHSAEILKKLDEKSTLVGLDLDADALEKTGSLLANAEKRILLKLGNFGQLRKNINALGIEKVDGILLDLGVSSHQIDTVSRGFTFMNDAPLDMRMSTDIKIKAEDVINDYSESELVRIFKDFGEERKSKLIARRIVQERAKSRIITTRQLVKIVENVASFKERIKSLARIFQAIRIEVNNEMENLRSFLEQSVDVLNSGGRIVIISYHSLEDRLVKNFFSYQANPCECPPDLPVCVCHKNPTIKILTRKIVVPTSEEVSRNPRSRSAKLRAFEKI